MAKKTKAVEEVTSSEIKLPDNMQIINPNAVVNVRISASFFNRLGIIFQRMIEDKTQEELANAYQQIEKKNISEMWIQDLETMVILINEFQKNAKAENQLKTITKEEYSKMMAESLGVN
jgi:hypothetical protein